MGPARESKRFIVSNKKNRRQHSYLHDGMGYFFLLPNPAVYTAKWKDEKQVEHITELPKIKNNGATAGSGIRNKPLIFCVLYTGIYKAIDTVHI
jgi:hypothetical protein